uniref:Cadherin-1 n=1 Tax=Sinocyclocheilus rhinocerous TaxID=307959 RepID=A0A673G8I1_9TELE
MHTLSVLTDGLLRNHTRVFSKKQQHALNSTIPGSHYVSTTVIPKTSNSMIRRKRAWLIPPVSISENDKGPFPKEVVKMKSTAAASINAALIYKITGPGADQPPKGLFRVDKYSGMLWVTKGLDREETEEYTITIHASAEDQSYTETPVKLTIKVIDQNDNKPLCTQNPFMGEVLERAKQYVPVIQVTAKDIDDPETANGVVRYKLVRQEPIGGVFRIDPASGVISLATRGVLDRETQTVYKLAVEAADMDGHGLSSTCVVIINITDSNDHAPKFSQRKYAGTVQENKAGGIVARLDVTDRDEPLTVNSVAKFTIIQGNEKGFFNISTGPSGMEGIITTSKQANSFSLLVVVENEVPFAVPLVTSNATITITVQDVNEPPVFEPAEKRIMILEDLAVGSTISKYTANDPDTAREQKIRYKLLQDFANWLEITEDTGVIRVRSSLDREASFIRNEQYTVLVLAYDNDDEPTTGTGTLVIKLLDINDNAPVLEERRVPMCLKEPKPVRLTITDPDGPENGPPFIIELHKEYQSNWTIIRNSSSRIGSAYIKFLLLLLLLLLKRRCGRKVHWEQFSQTEEDRDNILCYNEEGGGEQDQVHKLFHMSCSINFTFVLLYSVFIYVLQDFDMVLLCSRPEVFSTYIAPTASPMVFYRQHPDENEDIENFIYENLCTEDDDHYVVLYDSVLVFAHEGEGSEAGSLSSLQSSISDGDQDFQHLQNWGPQFRRLADMYAGGEDNM